MIESNTSYANRTADYNNKKYIFNNIYLIYINAIVKFNQALADYSASDNPHSIDGIVLTKFDTIDDKVSFKTHHFIIRPTLTCIM